MLKTMDGRDQLKEFPCRKRLLGWVDGAYVGYLKELKGSREFFFYW